MLHCRVTKYACPVGIPETCEEPSEQFHGQKLYIFCRDIDVLEVNRCSVTTPTKVSQFLSPTVSGSAISEQACFKKLRTCFRNLSLIRTLFLLSISDISRQQEVVAGASESVTWSFVFLPPVSSDSSWRSLDCNSSVRLLYWCTSSSRRVRGTTYTTLQLSTSLQELVLQISGCSRTMERRYGNTGCCRNQGTGQ